MNPKLMFYFYDKHLQQSDIPRYDNIMMILFCNFPQSLPLPH